MNKGNSDKLITHQYRANWALGSVYNWLSHKGTLHQSIRSTTQIWEVTFCRVTSEGIMKCWLFSQVVCLTCGHNEFQWLIKYENLTFPKRSNSISSLAVTDFSRSWTIKKNKPIEKTLIPSILILWLMNIPKHSFWYPWRMLKELKKKLHIREWHDLKLFMCFQCSLDNTQMRYGSSLLIKIILSILLQFII